VHDVPQPDQIQRRFPFSRSRPFRRRALQLPKLLQSRRNPRAVDGHPDLTGIWSNATRTPFERPEVFAEKRVSPMPKPGLGSQRNGALAGGATIDGGRPVTIQGGAYNVLFYDNGSGLARFDGQIELRWLSIRPTPPPAGPPGSTQSTAARQQYRRRLQGPFQRHPVSRRQHSRRPHDARPLQQQLPDRTVPDSILIMLEMVHDARIIHMNAQHEPPSVRQWFGDSIGRWKATRWLWKRRTSRIRHATGVPQWI